MAAGFAAVEVAGLDGGGAIGVGCASDGYAVLRGRVGCEAAVDGELVVAYVGVCEFYAVGGGFTDRGVPADDDLR